ncbi:high affinity immunoglobulin gamma Fc receptor I-like [Myripristis murdjan]|uniref:high affinity immunoglobulin gamma Fc receptor I-like n=1 Tax=Myripristis murdjan TaxID=586833 RepID=UPI001175E5EA|nr:high affinity immunoglobulin gamma Fc receptor I-like [Myripristis murdjan]
MEVTAVCLSLVMNVLMLLVAQIQRGCFAQNSDAALLHIDPNRLQLFQYEAASLNCEGVDGSTGWRVMRKMKRTIKPCSTNWETSRESSCSIKNAYAADNGEYWCENERGERSNVVNITVTAGSVVLVSPVLPVTEGSDVTLRCETQTTPSNLTADFYKDGFLFGNGSTGEMTIHSVSKSDEGFYKCSISDSEESPESWLAVRALHQEPHPLPWVLVTAVVALPALLLLLLLVGLVVLLRLGKHKGSGETSDANPQQATYAVITIKNRAEPGARTPAPPVTHPCPTEENALYSAISLKTSKKSQSN